jgi:hypothetical protein
MKALVASPFRVILALCFAWSWSSVVCAQHGGGGGGHGGGHFGGRGQGHASRFGPRAQPHGITRYPPLSVLRLFGRRHRRFVEPFFFSNGLFWGGVGGCDFWDWNCGFRLDDSDPGFGNWMNLTPAPGPTNPEGSSVSPFVTVLYLRNGDSVGVTEYWVENEEFDYLTTYGGENAIPFDQIDLERTVNENARRGIPFTLHPQPPPSPSRDR